ncbi:response regulator [Rhodobacteraceae bacterium CCMM004]|nr:response regulator [Rhodobacteraceae bacterium CCMM004]
MGSVARCGVTDILEQPATRGISPAFVWQVLGWGAAGLTAAGLLWLPAPAKIGVLAAAGTLAAMALALFVVQRRAASRRAALLDTVARSTRHARHPIFVTDRAGRILMQTAPATARYGGAPGAALAERLEMELAAPASGVARLLSQAGADGDATLRVGPEGSGLTVTVDVLDRRHVLWRVEHDDATLLASAPPMALADDRGAIVAATPALRTALGRMPRHLDDLVAGRFADARVPRLAAEGGAPLVTWPGVSGHTAVMALPGAAVAESGSGAFDALPVPILLIDADGRVDEANPPATRLLDGDATVGRPFADLVEGLGRPVTDWLADAQKGRGLGKPEVLRASGPATDLFLQITLGRLGDGPAARLVAVLHDATELKTLEAQFVQSQKMQAIGQLAGGVAHDFNNLLTAISGHCDLLLLRHDVDDPNYADLEQINQNANRAASLVGQLLAFSRKQNLRPELLDLRETLSDLTHLLDRLVGEKVRLDFEHDPDLQMVRADKRQLEQVIMNLVVNARDAMPDGGAIRIETSSERLLTPLERDRVVLPAGEYVVVRVTDEGMGIPPDKLPKIFEPFFTTKKTGEGTGLGLSTAYGIVKQTGGFIFADSQEGYGTRFSLFFPAHDRPVTDRAVPVGPAPAAVGAGDGVVLLVEDEAPVRAFAARALRMRGYTVLEAENAEDALDILADPSLCVDVFVTDVIMPGLDGPTWVKRALEDRPGTNVVFVSGYAEESFAEHQAQIPNSIFLPKPFSLADLTNTVHAQMQ